MRIVEDPIFAGPRHSVVDALEGHHIRKWTGIPPFAAEDLQSRTTGVALER